MVWAKRFELPIKRPKRFVLPDYTTPRLDQTKLKRKDNSRTKTSYKYTQKNQKISNEMSWWFYVFSSNDLLIVDKNTSVIIMLSHPHSVTRDYLSCTSLGFLIFRFYIPWFLTERGHQLLLFLENN